MRVYFILLLLIALTGFRLTFFTWAAIYHGRSRSIISVHARPRSGLLRLFLEPAATFSLRKEELFDALIVDAAPALRLFPFQIIAEKLRARIERRQRDFALLHHLQPPIHIRQTLQQRIPWTGIEGKRMLPSLSSETSTPSALPCRFASPITSLAT